MLDKLTRDDFAKLAGENFEIDFGDAGKVAGKLADVSTAGGPSKKREPFTIDFHCPHPAPPQQGIYKISHADIGEFEVFLVPIHGDEEGVVFEAVFN